LCGDASGVKNVVAGVAALELVLAGASAITGIHLVHGERIFG
jgi:hypothetical protein